MENWGAIHTWSSQSWNVSGLRTSCCRCCNSTVRYSSPTFRLRIATYSPQKLSQTQSSPNWCAQLSTQRSSYFDQTCSREMPTAIISSGSTTPGIAHRHHKTSVYIYQWASNIRDVPEQAWDTLCTPFHPIFLANRLQEETGSQEADWRITNSLASMYLILLDARFSMSCPSSQATYPAHSSPKLYLSRENATTLRRSSSQRCWLQGSKSLKWDISWEVFMLTILFLLLLLARLC